MPGHKDPEGTIMVDKDGKLFVSVAKEEKKEEEVKKVDLDLNGDGKVDKKDFSLAAKVLGSKKKKMRK